MVKRGWKFIAGGRRRAFSQPEMQKWPAFTLIF